MCFSHDSMLCASAGEDMKVMVHHVHSRALKLERQMVSAVSAVAFSPDESAPYLAIGCNDGAGLLLPPPEMSNLDPLSFNESAEINALSFAPDGSKLASIELSRRVVVREVSATPSGREMIYTFPLAAQPDGGGGTNAVSISEAAISCSPESMLLALQVQPPFPSVPCQALPGLPDRSPSFE